MCVDIFYIYECGHQATETLGIDRCPAAYTRDCMACRPPREAAYRLFPGIRGPCDRCERRRKRAAERNPPGGNAFSRTLSWTSVPLTSMVNKVRSGYSGSSSSSSSSSSSNSSSIKSSSKSSRSSSMSSRSSIDEEENHSARKKEQEAGPLRSDDRETRGVDIADANIAARWGGMPEMELGLGL